MARYFKVQAVFTICDFTEWSFAHSKIFDDGVAGPLDLLLCV